MITVLDEENTIEEKNWMWYAARRILYTREAIPGVALNESAFLCPRDVVKVQTAPDNISSVFRDVVLPFLSTLPPFLRNAHAHFASPTSWQLYQAPSTTLLSSFPTISRTNTLLNESPNGYIYIYVCINDNDKTSSYTRLCCEENEGRFMRYLYGDKIEFIYSIIIWYEWEKGKERLEINLFINLSIYISSFKNNIDADKS